MKSTMYVLATLACLALTFLITVRAADSPSNVTDSLLPSVNQAVECPNYKNCPTNYCIFHGKSTETKSKHFDADDTTGITCGSMDISVHFPATNYTNFTGSKTYTCFDYNNGNGSLFTVAEMNLNKPNDVNGSQVTCTFDGNNCTLQNETTDHIILVAGFPSNCSIWVQPTTPPPETTPTTPTTQSSTDSANSTTQTTDSGNSTKTVTTVTTAGSNATETTTPASSGKDSTTAKPGSGPADVARLEFAAVVAMAGALLFSRYM